LVLPCFSSCGCVSTPPVSSDIYPLSLHDALPISNAAGFVMVSVPVDRRFSWVCTDSRSCWLSQGLVIKSLAPRFIPSTARSRVRSEEHTSELQSRENLVCRLLLEKKNYR